MDFYDILKESHSGLRYIVSALLIVNLVKAMMGWVGKRPYTALDGKLSLFLLIAAHIQLLLGLVVYGLWVSNGAIFENFGQNMKDAQIRFYMVEHILAMIVAIVLITLGRILPKKTADDTSKFKKAFLCYLVAAVLIIAMVKWFPKPNADEPSDAPGIEQTGGSLPH